MRQLRAIDLFCCAGGATKGLQRAGFHVTGVLNPLPALTDTPEAAAVVSGTNSERGSL